jgi:hypothetical protein
MIVFIDMIKICNLREILIRIFKKTACLIGLEIQFHKLEAFLSHKNKIIEIIILLTKLLIGAKIVRVNYRLVKNIILQVKSA